MTNLPIAVLISGGGTTLKNLIRHKQTGKLPVDFRLVISSRRNSAGLAFATEATIDTAVVSRRAFSDPSAHSEAVFSICRLRGVQLVVMGGYLDHLMIPEDFENRVINIHPSLIPAFSGHGFYGIRVHQAALEHGVKLSGCTVHFVDNEFDHGPIIAQRACPAMATDTAEDLQRRVFELECQLYPEVIAAIATGRVTIDGRQVTVT